MRFLISSQGKRSRSERAKAPSREGLPSKGSAAAWPTACSGPQRLTDNPSAGASGVKSARVWPELP